jgi:hypothetical protein
LPTEDELKKLRAGAAQKALRGEDVTGMAELIDLVSGEDPGPEPQDS